jgi:hypothetical protein
LTIFLLLFIFFKKRFCDISSMWSMPSMCLSIFLCMFLCAWVSIYVRSCHHSKIWFHTLVLLNANTLELGIQSLTFLNSMSLPLKLPGLTKLLSTPMLSCFDTIVTLIFVTLSTIITSIHVAPWFIILKLGSKGWSSVPEVRVLM